MKPESDLGPRIRALRLSRQLSLAEVAAGTGVSEATMSRIETGHSQVSAPHLYGLAQIFGVELADFFQDPAPLRSRRSLTRAGEGAAFATPRLQARLMAGELRQKAMHPFLNRTTAHDLGQVGGLQGHAGEEYLHVLQGPLLFHSQTYAPLRLETGDSLYFDASDPHAYLTEPGAVAEFLVVTSHPLAKDQTP
jgi:transcriptional regulator with XRE-family HTH domain